jgi:hypothetical protein
VAAAVTPDAAGSAWDRLARALGDLDQGFSDREPAASAPPEGPDADSGEAAAARDGTPGDAAGGRALGDQLVELLQTWQRNLQAHTGPECRVCPVCQLVALLRRTRPEVLEHLVGAAGELAAAVRMVVGEPRGPHPGGNGTNSRGSMPVERIDVTD